MKFKNKKLIWLLNQPLFSSLLVAFVLGLWSLFLGQDRNWDLANYHLYNAFSFMNDKLDKDFAVAGIQTYLNPLLDIPYYIMSIHLKAPYVGFLMGFIQGFAFLLILLITRNYQDKIIQKTHVILFALTGIITPNYLSELGNTMGDNITAILNLTSILLIVGSIDKFKSQVIPNKYLFYSGLIMGISTGLKLTNAPFALAAAIALIFAGPKIYKSNFRNSIHFSLFVFIGILISSGFWFIKMWSKFHNPVFPLYSNLFPNEFIESNLFNDDSFGPKNTLEIILWPFISSFNYLRFGRGLIHQIYWPVIYILLIIIFVKKINPFIIKSKLIFEGSKEKFIILFAILSYVISVKIFSMQRYLITIELLAPLLTYLCFRHINYRNQAWKNTKNILIASVLLTLLGGFGTWGHSSWKSEAFKAEIPQIYNQKKTTALITDLDAPLGWIVTLFPKDLSFIRVGIFHNEKGIINAKLQENLGGGKFALFSGYYNWRKDNVKKWSDILSSLDLLSNEKKCNNMQNFISKIHFRGQIIMNENNQKNACFIDLHPNDKANENDQNRTLIESANNKLQKLNLHLNKPSCTVFKAYIGGQNWRYIWCEIL